MILFKNGSGVARSLLTRAKRGHGSQIGELLDAYRKYLCVIADRQLDQKLRARISPSDIVQETMLEAHRDFGQFRGENEHEFAGWLRKILANTLARAIEMHVQTKKRDVRRDVPLANLTAADQSTGQLQFDFAARVDTPSFDARRNERSAILAASMADLPSAQREVLLLRNIRGLKFQDVAKQMNRSIPATKMLWMRAIKHLRKLYEDRDAG